jgi:hypothetical protein
MAADCRIDAREQLAAEPTAPSRFCQHCSSITSSARVEACRSDPFFRLFCDVRGEREAELRHAVTAEARGR